MKEHTRTAVVLIALLCMSVIGIGVMSRLRNRTALPPSSPDEFSLITEPDDGIAPVLAMIAGATRSVDMVMYELDDRAVERALAAAEARGVAVRVILSEGYDGASSTVNAAAFDALRAAGVPVRWSPPYFALAHQKSIVVDADASAASTPARALVMTFNLVAKYYPTGRDFGIVDRDPRDVAAIEGTFDDDWSGTGAAQGGNNGDRGDDLVWSPGSASALVNMIRASRRSLFVYNEEMADGDVVAALIDAAKRGVAVEIAMTGADEWKWEFTELTTAGVSIRTYADAPSAPLYIHAKTIVVDNGTPAARAFVGSENFSASSFDANRELGIILADPTIIASLMRTFTADWRGATPFVLK